MWIGHLDMEMNVSDRIHPRSTREKKKGVFIRKNPGRPFLLIFILLILAFPPFKFETGAGQRFFPAVANFFYNISGPPPPPTPTPLPPFPASLPQFGSLLYTVQSGDSCDEMLTVQMHMADAGQIFSDVNPNTVKALSSVMGRDRHALQPGMVTKLSPQYPLTALGGVVLKVAATTPQQPLPTPLIHVARQQAGIDCSNGCLLTVRIAPGTQVRLLVQTALPLHIGSWVWAQAMLARQQITGFANYPYVDPNVCLNGMLLRACDLQEANTNDDISLA